MNKLPQLKEAIVVEGKYDKIALCNVVNTIIVETNGFCIVKNLRQLTYIKKLADSCGIVILTDSDIAGFNIRRFLSGTLPPSQVKHAYIPLIPGKERRKAIPSKSGNLGVEGIAPKILLDALKSAGATFLDQNTESSEKDPVTMLDLFEMGLMGQYGSQKKRIQLLASLGLPPYISNKNLLKFLNSSRKNNLTLKFDQFY